ncbi:MAG: PAS domain S-box protein [Deltaproteobacteria bacterium]|nr:PAS domain S-box protein [Deltaproteobacteria bacterium]
MEARSLFGLKIRHVLVGALVFLGLYLSSLYSYLLFHSIAAVFSVSVAGTVFMVSWNTRRSPDAGYFSFLGIGCLFVGGFGFLHLLSYKGMGVFPGYGANLPTQFWIASRYVLSVTFLAATVFAGRTLNHRLTLVLYSAGAALLLASIFAWKVFPDCFIEGTGLTPFKKISEYVVSAILLASIVFLGRKKERFDRDVLQILVASIVVAVASDMAFTLYTDVYGILNLVGHFLEIFSFYLVYRAIVATDLVRKHELSRRLQEELAERSRTERTLLDTQKELRNRQAELTALLEGSRSVLTRREFQDAAQSIFLSCKNLFGAAAGYVALLSSDGAENEIAFLDPGGLPCTVDPSLPMPIRGLRAEAYRTGKAVFENDFSRSEWTRYLPEGHANLENVLFAPLLVEGKTVGLIGLANKTGGFTDDDARIASAFGELAAVALLNSRMLESLEESEERFRSVAQTANDAIISIDESGAVILWNQGAERMFGYTAEEMVGRPLSGIIPPRLRGAHEEGMARAFLSGTSRFAGKTLEMAGFRKDGGEFPLELSMANWKAGEKTFFTGILRDITERKRAEKELQTAKEGLEERVKERTAELSILADRLQEELAARRMVEETLERQATLLQSVMDSVGDGVVVADRDGKILLLNPEGERIVRQGVTDTRPDEWSRQFGFFLPDSVTPCPTDRIPLVRAIGDESFDDSELFVRYGPGTEEGVWISCSGRPLKDNTGVLQGGVVVFRDITARKRTEEALRDSMAQLEKIFSNIHLCVVHLDSEFRFLRVNKAYADSCGYPPEFFPGKNHFALYPHAENEAIFRKVVETGEPYHVIAKPFEFPDHPEWGITYWDWSLLPLQEPDGKVSSLIFCLIDVTERRRAEEELARSEERFRSLVNGSPVGIFILQNGGVVYMNPEQKRIFGEMPEFFVLRNFPDVHPEDREKFESFCDAALSDGSGPLDMELRFYPFGKSSEGVDLRWVHCRATSIRSPEERVYLVNMVDITRLKEMEHQVVIREKLASLGHVAAGIAHEIRSPLSGINIYMAALQQIHGEAECMEPEAREQAGEIVLQIQSASQRIESVIKKVMDFTRPAAPRKESVDISMAVENAIDFTAANLRKNGITLDRSRLVSLPKCSADPPMITQVAMNLISNAAIPSIQRGRKGTGSD